MASTVGLADPAFFVDVAVIKWSPGPLPPRPIAGVRRGRVIEYRKGGPAPDAACRNGVTRPGNVLGRSRDGAGTDPLGGCGRRAPGSLLRSWRRPAKDRRESTAQGAEDALRVDAVGGMNECAGAGQGGESPR